FVSGNNTIGKREVAGIGTASVIHQTAIQLVLAKTARASGFNPSGVNNNIINTNNNGPRIKPSFCANLYLLLSPLSLSLLLLYKSDFDPRTKLVFLADFFALTTKLNISLISSCLSHNQFQAVFTLIPPNFLFLCFKQIYYITDGYSIPILLVNN